MRHLRHQRWVRVDTDYQPARAPPGRSIGERTVAGAEVNVGFGKRSGALGQSSTVYPALASSTDEKHAATVPCAGRMGQLPRVMNVKGQQPQVFYGTFLPADAAGQGTVRTITTFTC